MLRLERGVFNMQADGLHGAGYYLQKAAIGYGDREYGDGGRFGQRRDGYRQCSDRTARTRPVQHACTDGCTDRRYRIQSIDYCRVSTNLTEQNLRLAQISWKSVALLGRLR